MRKYSIKKDESKELTVEQLKDAVPRKCKSAITEQFVEKLNGIIDEPAVRDTFKENLIGFAGILQEPNISIEAYVNAVKYVSFKMTGCTNQEAWSRTFPDRLAAMKRKGRSDDVIRAAVSAYSKGKVVTALLEQSMVPTWILNADIYQQAVNTQAEIMMTARSEKVRSDAAHSLLTHLKPPEAVKMELDIGLKEDNSVIAMREALTELVQTKRKAIEAGTASAGEIAHSKIIDVEAEVIEK